MEPTLSDIPCQTHGITPDDIGKLPALPGVYMFLDEKGAILYVGKSVNLNSRVSSYFGKSGDPRFNVRLLMRHVARVQTIITANEKEAFLLENTLIKKHQPRYNIRLRDDKTYVSVRINTGHEWPRAIVVRRRHETKEDGAVLLGPYSSAGSVRDTLRQLQRIFPIRSCPDHVLGNRARPCLLHQIGRCCAPCTKPVDKELYAQYVEGTILFLKGKTKEVVEMLEKQMQRYAENLEFERAAVLRDRIAAINQTTERQNVQQHQGGADRDLIVLDQMGGFGAFVVFLYRNGLLVSSKPFLVRDHERAPEELMSEFIARYYETEVPPRELLTEPAPESAEVLEDWLGERREGRVEIQTPQRGEKRQLIEVAHENARQLLKQHLSGQKTIEEMLQEVTDKLGLPGLPDPIECYDISTIQGFATVGSMVTFRSGEPDKTRYRRFMIKSLQGQDDFGAMREMLTRRLRKVADGSEAAPGLIVVDGGKGQLAVALSVMEEMGVNNTPVVGMAKARVKHRGDTIERTEERFFLPGRKNPVVFKPNSPALYMLVRLRDEAHRFGITYHRELRKRKNLRSALESIAGVGKTRAAALLRHFGSLKKIREATREEIAAVPGMPAELAARIFDWLRASAEGAWSPWSPNLSVADAEAPAPEPGEEEIEVDEALAAAVESAMAEDAEEGEEADELEVEVDSDLHLEDPREGMHPHADPTADLPDTPGRSDTERWV